MASSRVSTGDPAPDFTLPREDGGEFHLADVLGSRPIILYFYPRDDSPGCTAQACAFRDRYAAFTEAGAEVVGVSRDTVASHDHFAHRHRLPFPLLSDPDGRVHRLYGVPRALGGLIPGRLTYVIDRKGIVRRVFDSVIPTAHIGAALAGLRDEGSD